MPQLVTTPFGFSTTADEVLDGVDLSGRRALVTGGASGIGRETARALAAAGAEVVIAVRDASAGRRVAAEIMPASRGSVDAFALDLADLDSVDALVAGWRGPLHILVNNAGVMAVPEWRSTAQGHELQFGTNFLGHFALTAGLSGALRSEGGRIVSVSSNAHFLSDVVFDDVDYLRRDYDRWGAYGQSKTGDVLLAVAANQRWSRDGVHANALNPGAVPTGLQRHTGGLQTPEDKRKTPAQGASTSALLAASPLVEGIGGRYFEDCIESPALDNPPEMFGAGVATYALDRDHAAQLWDLASAFLSNR